MPNATVRYEEHVINAGEKDCEKMNHVVTTTLEPAFKAFLEKVDKLIKAFTKEGYPRLRGVMDPVKSWSNLALPKFVSKDAKK